MFKKSTIIFIGLAVITVFFVGYRFLGKKQPTYETFVIERGQVIQEVSETGTVQKGETIELGFKTAGRLASVNIQVGDQVESGQALASLDTVDLNIQLQEARSGLAVAQAKYDKLLAGLSLEEIKVAETAVDNALIALEEVQQDLIDTQISTEENLDQAYEDAMTTLDDAYLKAYNASNIVDSVYLSYFGKTDVESLTVKEKKNEIKKEVLAIKVQVDIVENNDNQENIDAALAASKRSLEVIANDLRVVRETCDESNYRNAVSSADKSALDTQRSNINTALGNVITDQQNISSTKITNQTNLNNAQAQVVSTKGALVKAQDELAFKKAGARQQDLDLAQAEINQAQAKIRLLENQIQETNLRSPVRGQIAAVNKRAGETIQITESLLSLIPENPFQVEVDIYEEDIIKIEIGNPVKISLPALAEQIFKGKVVSIEPAEKLIEGVVYYEAVIGFESAPVGIKPGMTADIVIQTAIRENVIAISSAAVQKENGRLVVEVLQGKEIKKRVIEIGLKGSNNQWEVISGLELGETIILK